MDIFKFTSMPNAPMRNGELIRGQTSVTWVERYREPGEIKLEAGISSDLRKILPVGSAVSHIDTREVIRIEDHEIEDNDDGDPKLVITGRTIEASLLESRVAGSNITFPTAAVPQEYVIPAAATVTQAISIIRHHIEASFLIDDRDAIPYMDATPSVSTNGLTVEERKIKPGSVYERLSEILDVDNLGIRSERPIGGQNSTRLIIHKGVDRSGTVVLSADKGDVSNLGYLESDRKRKNCALVVGRWCQTRVVDASVSGYDRRWMAVEASDIDESYETMPTAGVRTTILAKMAVRGREALARNKKIEITKVEANNHATMYSFRKDYNVGDIVMIKGGYGANTKMRVSEYVEIQDENGFTGYPTLEPLEGTSI